MYPYSSILYRAARFPFLFLHLSTILSSLWASRRSSSPSSSLLETQDPHLSHIILRLTCSPPSQLSLYRFPALRHKSCITPLCSRTHPGVRAGFRWLIHTIFALRHTSLDFSVSPLSWVHRIGPLGWCLSTTSIEYGRQAL